MFSKKGFTLVELLVVIAVIGLLSLLTVLSLGQKREQMRDFERISAMRELQNNLELFFAIKSAYPMAPEPGIVLGEGQALCLQNEGFSGSNCESALLPVVPKDPGDFQYTYVSNGNTYTISGELEGKIDGFEGKIRVTPNSIQNVSP